MTESDLEIKIACLSLVLNRCCSETPQNPFSTASALFGHYRKRGGIKAVQTSNMSTQLETRTLWFDLFERSGPH
jgi:hypothetical protein